MNDMTNKKIKFKITVLQRGISKKRKGMGKITGEQQCNKETTIQTDRS
jgi:hypothetical protein